MENFVYKNYQFFYRGFSIIIRLLMKSASHMTTSFGFFIYYCFLLVIVMSTFTTPNKYSQILTTSALHYLIILSREDDPMTESSKIIFLPSIFFEFNWHFISCLCNKESEISAHGLSSIYLIKPSLTMILG